MKTGEVGFALQKWANGAQIGETGEPGASPSSH